MELEKARQVLWLHNYPRPMGQLFDEGFLNRGRLEWAVRKAWDPELREAAKAFLTQLSTRAATAVPGSQARRDTPAPGAFDVGIGLEQARAKPWPFGVHKGEPMGGLLAAGLISLRDLAFAIENAFDDTVRRAATALMLERLEQVLKEPPPQTGLLRVMTGGRSYSERRQSRLILLEGLALGITIGMLIFILVWAVLLTLRGASSGQTAATFSSQPVIGIVLAAALAAGLGLLVGWLISRVNDQLLKRLDKLIEEYRFGQEGEDRTIEVILQALDGTWQVFRNVGLPGRNPGDLDIVLVGPPGVWVLEVKNLRGEYRNIGDRWEWKRGHEWTAAPVKASRQAHDNATRLGGFLRADGINDVYVNDAVVWANPECPPTVENPSVAVWPLERLADELGNLWQGQQLTAAEKAKIVEKLTRLCERERAGDAAK